MSKRKEKSKKSNNKANTADNNDISNIPENISEDDLQSLFLLDIQLKATLTAIYGQILLCTANLQGRQVIFDKYKSDTESTISPIVPDKTVLEATYIFFAMKLIFIEIAFTRYNTVYEKKMKGDFPYSLAPDEKINAANLLDLISCIYYIKAAEEILARDNNQPVFGIR